MTTEPQLKLAVESFEKAPHAEACRRIDWQQGNVVPGFINDTYFLTVRGEKPWLNMEVKLLPKVHVQRPEYWEIEVDGCLSGIGLPAVEKYDVTIELTAASGLGTQGIRVVGATKSSDKIKVPPGGSFSPK